MLNPVARYYSQIIPTGKSVSRVLALSNNRVLAVLASEKSYIFDSTTGQNHHVSQLPADITPWSETTEGELLFSTPGGASLESWDFSDKIRSLHTIPGHFLSIVISLKTHSIACGTSSGSIETWNPNSNETVDLTGHTQEIVSLYECPDNTLVSSAKDCTVIFWSQTGEQLRKLSHDSVMHCCVEMCGRLVMAFHDSLYVNDVEIAKDPARALMRFTDTLFVIGWASSVVTVWNIDTGKPVCDLKNHAHSVTTVRPIGDNKSFMSISKGENKIVIWSPCPADNDYISFHNQLVHTLLVGSDNKVFCHLGNNAIYYVDLHNRQAVTLCQQRGIALLPNGGLLLTGDETISIYSSGKIPDRLSVNSSDLKYLTAFPLTNKKVIVQYNSGDIDVWNLDQAVSLAIPNFSIKEPLIFLGYDHKNRALTKTQSGEVFVWNPEDGDISRRTQLKVSTLLPLNRGYIIATASGELILKMELYIDFIDRTFEKPQHKIIKLIALSEKPTLFASLREDGQIHIWDCRQKRPLLVVNAEKEALLDIKQMKPGQLVAGGLRGLTTFNYELVNA